VFKISLGEYTGKDFRAFIVKISGSVEKMFAESIVMIGWSKADGLLDENLTKDDFREIIHKQYFPLEEKMRRAGQVAGDLWRFIREMNLEHYVLVPAKEGFYIGKVTGPATYNEMRIFSDTAYERKVEWLNNKEPISPEKTPEELQTRLKSVQSVIDASDLYQEIEFALRIS
jgi:predicted Mrr-cat superfamily restriction endonuclease